MTFRKIFVIIMALLLLSVTGIAIYLDITDTTNPENDILYVIHDEDGNEFQNFTVAHDMNVSYIEVNRYNITFNSTTFDIDAQSSFLIRLDYIHPNISTNDTIGLKMLGFYIDQTTGPMYYNLTGFNPATDYVVKRNLIDVMNCTADTNGVLYFSDTTVGGGFPLYEIFIENITLIEISDEYPVNLTIGNATDDYRPPINMSAQINGSGLDIYFYFINMTGVNPVWTLIQNFSGDTGRYEVSNANLTTFGCGTEFIWGNTSYNWSINVTDGNIWVNESFYYRTNQTNALGSNLRYDLNADGNIDFGDISLLWSMRTGQAPYDGLYDVSNDDSIDFGDISMVWSNRD